MKADDKVRAVTSSTSKFTGCSFGHDMVHMDMCVHVHRGEGGGVSEKKNSRKHIQPAC